MNDSVKINGPVAIGGIGGSGTRVVVEILIKLGYFMGSDLNRAKDNLWFTLLFRNPQWFARKIQKKEEDIYKALEIFYKAMMGELRLNATNLRLLTSAVIMLKLDRISGFPDIKNWSIKSILHIIRNKKISFAEYRGWGWKEPNTHIYLEYISNYFSNVRYIHVIRNGLDMAFSLNQYQLYNWGVFFDIDHDSGSHSLPYHSLQYWIKANRKAREIGERLLPGRFLIVNFDMLCIHPEHEILKILEFLDINREFVNLDELKRIPEKPKSLGRYMKHDLSIFNHKDLTSVEEFGFQLNGVD